MKLKLLMTALVVLLLVGCSSQTTALKFTLDGTDFEMTSPKEVSAGYMALTSPSGMTLVLSNYVSKVSAPTDALGAALEKAISAYMAKPVIP